MLSLSATVYFRILAALAIVSLWGVSLWNGTVEALIVAVWNGHLADGTPLKTDYTGIYLVDFPLSLLVAFFFYGSNGHDPGYQHFLIDAYSTLQSAFVWLYVESARKQNKPASISSPVIWGMIWQVFGAAISLPLYFASHLRWLDHSGITPQAVDDVSALAIPFSFIFGAVLPAIVGMRPGWIDPASRSPRSHQIILAAWQPDPVWVSIIQQLIGFIAIGYKTAIPQKSYRWVRAALLVAAASSAFGHLYVMRVCLGSTDANLSAVRMYVPFFHNGPSNTSHILIRGPWLFLQYDLIIIAISSLSWAYALLHRLLPGGFQSRLKMIMFLGIGALTVGPGATVSMALFWREGMLHKLRKSMEKC